MRISMGPQRRSRGFTLVELLLGLALSGVALGSVAYLAVHQIRLADTAYASVTVDRSFRRLSDLLRAEVSEACLLRGDEDPLDDPEPDLPDTRCNPRATSVCAPATAADDLWLLIPVLAPGSNNPSLETVNYYLDDDENQLLRVGPRVNANGALVPGTSDEDAPDRVLTNVSSFVATVSADCTWVTLQVGLTVPGTGQVVNRTLTLYSGATGSIF